MVGPGCLGRAFLEWICSFEVTKTAILMAREKQVGGRHVHWIARLWVSWVEWQQNPGSERRLDREIRFESIILAAVVV